VGATINSFHKPEKPDIDRTGHPFVSCFFFATDWLAAAAAAVAYEANLNKLSSHANGERDANEQTNRTELKGNASSSKKRLQKC